MGTRAHSTDASRNRRCRKGLEPSRRMSETTGPRCLRAFRIAVPRTGVTRPCPGCNRSGGSCIHCAPGSMPFPQRTIARARGPHRSGGSRTCSRSAGRGAARVERSRRRRSALLSQGGAGASGAHVTVASARRTGSRSCAQSARRQRPPVPFHGVVCIVGHRQRFGPETRR